MKLLYFEYNRTGREIETDEEGLTTEIVNHLSRSYIVNDEVQITNILTRWFKYIVSGSEGENRAEGCGWYFRLVMIFNDHLEIDVTQQIIEHEKYKDLMYRTDTYCRLVWNN